MYTMLMKCLPKCFRNKANKPPKTVGYLETQNKPSTTVGYLETQIKQIEDDGDRAHGESFLNNPTYKNSNITIGMWFLAKHLTADEFRQCIEFIEKEEFWKMDTGSSSNDSKARDAFKDKLMSFKEQGFIDKLKNDEDEALRELKSHFWMYEGGRQAGLIYIRADRPIEKMKGFLSSLMISKKEDSDSVADEFLI